MSSPTFPSRCSSPGPPWTDPARAGRDDGSGRAPGAGTEDPLRTSFRPLASPADPSSAESPDFGLSAGIDSAGTSSAGLSSAGASRLAALGLAVLLCLIIAVGVAVLRACAYRPVPMAEVAAMSRPRAEETGPAADFPFLLEEARAAMGYRWNGAFHVHSVRSDGTGTVEEIAAAASAVGLDFVVVTDHNPIGPGGRPDSGWYEGVLVIVGEELTTREGHVVALGLPSHGYRFAPWARRAVEDVRELGGWVIAAHPFHGRVPWTGGSGLPVGLEAISLTDRWSSLPLPRKAAVVGLWPFADDYAAIRLLALPAPTLETFDRLTALAPDGPTSRSGPRARGPRASPRGSSPASPGVSSAPTPSRGPSTGPTAPRPRVMVGAADAHGGVSGLPWPGYEGAFRALQTAVWTPRPPDPEQPAEEAERLILEALRRGRAAAVVTAVGTAPDFSFTARTRAGGVTRWVVAGEMAPAERGPWRLRLDMGSPGPYELVLLRDGRRVESTVGEPLEVSVDRPGTYRAEVYRARAPAGAGQRGSTPWIVSNPIYVWPPPARSAAQVHPVPPLPAPPVFRSLLAEPGRPESGWGAESSGDVTVSLSRLPGSIDWELRLPDSPGPDSYAALAWRTREPEDWSAAHGLVVRLAAERPLRPFLELRTRGADGRLRGWRTSAKAVPGSRTTPLPFREWELWWEEGDDEDSAAAGAREVAVGGDPVAGPGAEARQRVEGLFLIVTADLLPDGSGANVQVIEAGLY